MLDGVLVEAYGCASSARRIGSDSRVMNQSRERFGLYDRTSSRHTPRCRTFGIDVASMEETDGATKKIQQQLLCPID